MKNIFLIVFCLLVSTVWAKEEKNKRIQYCTTLEEAMQQAARIILDSSIKSSMYWEYTQNTSSSESK